MGVVPAAPNCSFSAEAVERVHRMERCHCGAAAPALPPHPGRALLARRQRRARLPAWGLPTAACPAARYLVKDYPRQYQRLRSEGRILFHCSRAGGLGDYMRSVPEAIVLAVLLERAFVLRCDTSTKDEGIHVPWPHVLPLHFVGAHFDWRGLPSPLPNASELSIVDTLVTADAWHGARARFSLTELNRSAAPAVRVITDAKSLAATRLLRQDPDLAAERFGTLATLPPDQLTGCMLRYLFRPSRRLHFLLRALLPAVSERLVASASLLPTAALHVRLGDAVWAHPTLSPLSAQGTAVRLRARPRRPIPTHSSEAPTPNPHAHSLGGWLRPLS